MISTYAASPKIDTALSKKFSLLVIISIVATAFNDISPILPIGEMSKDAFIYILPFLFMSFLLSPGDFSIPASISFFMIGILTIIAIGVILNYNEISVASFRGRGGMSRVITQVMSIAFGFIVSILFYNFVMRGYAQVILYGAVCAILTMGAIGLIEFGSWFSIPGPTQLYEFLSIAIHDETNDYYPTRLRTTAFEVSWAGVFLTFLFPFAVANLKVSKRTRILIYATAYCITILAQSRTATLVMGIQTLMLIWFSLRGQWHKVVFALTALCVLGTTAMVTPGVGPFLTEKTMNIIEYGSANGSVQKEAVYENISNVTRLAAIRAGLDMFKERPVFGVGLGQYGFNYPKHLRSEDFRSWEVREYVTAGDNTYGWPPTYSLHVRLLAETGIIGYIFWMSLVLYLLVRSLRNLDPDTLYGRLHMAVAMTLTGWILLGFSIDSFRFFGGWIAIGVAFALPNKKKALNYCETIS